MSQLINFPPGAQCVESMYMCESPAVFDAFMKQAYDVDRFSTGLLMALTEVCGYYSTYRY